MNTFTQSAPLKILVVEDNPGDYILLKENIHLAKIPVASIRLTETITDAIAELQQAVPDIIFLDLYLPDSNGLDTFERLKDHAAGSTVIILSGLSDTKTALEAIAQGAQDYLNKGEFDEKLLSKTITYAIERRRNLEKLRLANERYSLVTKATHDLIWDWDLVTGDIYRDETAVRNVYGYSTNTAIGTIDDWYERIHPDDAPGLFKLIPEIKTSIDKDFFEIEYRFRTEMGEYKNIYDRGYIVRDPEGKPVRLIGAAQDITEKRKLEAALEESRLQKQKAITEATIIGQENEREELGKELHDNINQILATSRLFLDHVLSAPEIKRELLVRSREFIILAIQEIRKLSHSLLPPTLKDFGLASALSKLTDTIAGVTEFRICKHWDDFDESLFTEDQKLTVYRIVQEQLNNIVKHAEARQVKISIKTDKNKSVRLLITDDGKGFDPKSQKNGVGLRNIISRAELFDGAVTIQSSPGKGCRLEIVFPSCKSLKPIYSEPTAS